MSPGDPRNRNLILVQQMRDEDDDQEQFKPLAWGLILRLFRYARPVKRKVIALVVLTTIRSAQLPALFWISSRVIAGPIARGEAQALAAGTLAYGLLAVLAGCSPSR